MTQKIKENAHKIAFLIHTYPDKNLDEILMLMTGMPEVDINAAVWYAMDFELINRVDPQDKKVYIIKAPEKWEFGTRIQEMQDTILFCYRTNLVGREYDLDEREMADWLFGYPGYDVLIALNHMLDTKQLATYELTDPLDLKSTYKFYTLFENGENMWGRSRFPKQQPTGAEKPDTSNHKEDATNE